jgi:two-component system, chemotaxis family, protein-glutamate methylesterase/glutaminase
VKRVRVVIADDSNLCREILRTILEEEGDIEVVGEASDGSEAHELVRRLRPGVLTLDIEMPKTDGLSAIGRIMSDCPTPIVVVTGRPAEQRSLTLFEAVRRGALDLVPKPTLGNVVEAKALRVLVRRMASVPVVKHLPTRSMRPNRAMRLPAPVPPLPRSNASDASVRPRLMAIGASAGGPAAVAAVLRELPERLPASIAVVQHLLPGFTRPFADFLRVHTKLEVKMVDRPVTLHPGMVYVAPDDCHLVASGFDQLAPFAAAPVSGHRPSVDVLLQSMAKAMGKAAGGVILTGMGEDGADGLLALSREGGITIAQSKEGCAVYGMPRAALLNGGARQTLPLAEIAAAIIRFARDQVLP